MNGNLSISPVTPQLLVEEFFFSPDQPVEQRMEAGGMVVVDGVAEFVEDEKRISKSRITIASSSLFAVSIDSRRVTSRIIVANTGPASKKSARSALDVAAGALCLHGAEWF